MADEKLMLKANTLGGMNAFVLDYIGDENVIEMWQRNAIPDGCDEEMLMEIAEDDELFCDCANWFAKCLRCM